jgi:hypothetical protein
MTEFNPGRAETFGGGNGRGSAQANRGLGPREIAASLLGEEDAITRVNLIAQPCAVPFRTQADAKVGTASDEREYT